MTKPAHGAISPLRRGDPLAALRTPDAPALDVLLSGQVFFDIVFTDLPEEPAPGTEVWARDMGSGPGGISNLAVAASRLGLRTGLAAGFGDDVYGSWCWDVLSEQEGIDMPIMTEVYRVLFEGKTARDATHSLMLRPLRGE